MLWHGECQGATGERDCGIVERCGGREEEVVPSSEGFIVEDRFEGGREFGVFEGGEGTAIVRVE